MKKKGFTLIELLAVIVILAIIALIATPLVLKYIETARKGAFENTIESVERATELKLMQIETEGKIEYPFELDVKDLDLKNKDKLNGTVTIEKDANNKYIYTYDITDNEYKIYGTKDSEVYKLDKTVKLKLKTANGVIDDDNNWVYSFYNVVGNPDGYETISMNDCFEAENGIIEFQKSAVYNTDSTGSKIILKDKNNKVVKVYTVIIFGDIDGNGGIDMNDVNEIDLYINKLYKLNKNIQKAADLNNDGIINNLDSNIGSNYAGWFCDYSQITRVCEEY